MTTAPDWPDFATELRRERATRAIGLRQLARLAGISHPAIHAYERGTRHPASATVVTRLAVALGCSSTATTRLLLAAGFRPQPAIWRWLVARAQKADGPPPPG